MRVAVATAAAVLVCAAVLAAQQPGFTRTPLLDQPLGVSGRHGVTARVEVEPGAESTRHTHPGDEFEYVAAGALQLEIDGQPPRIYSAGDVFFVPAGVVHNGRNAGTVRTVMIGTFFAETGKPLTTLVK